MKNLFLVLLSVFVLFSVSANAVPLISAKNLKDKVNVEFTFDNPVTVEKVVKDNEIVLSFNQPVDGLDTSKVYGVFPEWIEEFSNSYDKAIFMTTLESSFSVLVQDKKVFLTITPKVAIANDNTFSEVNIMITEENYIEARELIKKHLEKNKRDMYGLSLYAQTQQGLNNYASALDTYFTILEELPNDIGTNKAKQFAFAQIASNAGAGYQYSDYDDGEYQNIFTYNLRAFMATETKLLISGSVTGVKVDDIQNLDGSVSNYSYKYYNNIVASLVHEATDQLDIMPSLYISDDIIGGGVAFIYNMVSNGIFTLAFDYNKPDFDSSRQIVLDASTDNVTFGFQSNFRDNWSWSAQIGYVNYSYKDKANVADSIDTLATVSYEFLPMKQDSLILFYSMSGRYFLKNDKGIDTFGQSYRYSTASTSEVHAINLTWIARMAGNVSFSPYVGFAYDRYNKGGPVYGISLKKEEFNRFDLELYANKNISTYDGSDRDVYSFGVNFNLKF